MTSDAVVPARDFEEPGSAPGNVRMTATDSENAANITARHLRRGCRVCSAASKQLLDWSILMIRCPVGPLHRTSAATTGKVRLNVIIGKL
jgi:hypothetical protein